MPTSPLRMERLLNDVWYAVSMYFADQLKTTLKETNQQGVLFLILILLLALQSSVEHWVVTWFHGQTSLWSEIVIEYIYMCSRTLAFLMVSFSIDMLAAQEGHDYFWAERFFVPAIVLLVGIAILKYVQHTTKLHKYK